MPNNLVDRLDQEWRELSDNDAPVPPEWRAECSALSDCPLLTKVLDAVRAAPDEVLGYLIRRFRCGDTTAGRTVLQSMLGKLVKMSYTGIAAQTPHALDDLVVQMWCHIASYPLAARPQHIAANLALDTLKAAQRGWQTPHEIPMPPATIVRARDTERLSYHSPTTNTVQLVDTAHRLGLITRTTRDILLAVYGPEGLSGAMAAERWSCSPAAIRTRCRDAIRTRLAPHADQLVTRHDTLTRC
jgi:DNA-directed RNA polymerase specialized sigma24 family protein